MFARLSVADAAAVCGRRDVRRVRARGHLIQVTTASVHDSTGGEQALTEPAAAHPSGAEGWADDGCRAGVGQHGAGLDVEVARRPKEKASRPCPRGG
ncbi:hypothetical protein ACWGUP_02570 [Streptomyces diastaticus]|uniref:hypothetical protein n=1 Tax=Streptomyces diastaticus TaxID=1956 RepID=UPI003D183A43